MFLFSLGKKRIPVASLADKLGHSDKEVEDFLRSKGLRPENGWVEISKGELGKIGLKSTDLISSNFENPLRGVTGVIVFVFLILIISSVGLSAVISGEAVEWISSYSPVAQVVVWFQVKSGLVLKILLIALVLGLFTFVVANDVWEYLIWSASFALLSLAVIVYVGGFSRSVEFFGASILVATISTTIAALSADRKRHVVILAVQVLVVGWASLSVYLYFAALGRLPHSEEVLGQPLYDWVQRIRWTLVGSGVVLLAGLAFQAIVRDGIPNVEGVTGPKKPSSRQGLLRIFEPLEIAGWFVAIAVLRIMDVTIRLAKFLGIYVARFSVEMVGAIRRSLINLGVWLNFVRAALIFLGFSLFLYYLDDLVTAVVHYQGGSSWVDLESLGRDLALLALYYVSVVTYVVIARMLMFVDGQWEESTVKGAFGAATIVMALFCSALILLVVKASVPDWLDYSPYPGLFVAVIGIPILVLGLFYLVRPIARLR